MKDLLYLRQNNNVPRNRVTSTARKGSKWFDGTSIGDVVMMRNTEDHEPLGKAAIVAKEFIEYQDVIANADHNHVGVKGVDNGPALAAALTAAYGESAPTEKFTVLHILPLNESIA